eukprot:15483058-Alexandrium_andersonii.AAC.1
MSCPARHCAAWSVQERRSPEWPLRRIHRAPLALVRRRPRAPWGWRHAGPTPWPAQHWGSRWHVPPRLGCRLLLR